MEIKRLIKFGLAWLVLFFQVNISWACCDGYDFYDYSEIRPVVADRWLRLRQAYGDTLNVLFIKLTR